MRAFLILFFLLSVPFNLGAANDLYSELTLRNLQADEQGFLVNTTSDGFLIMGGMDLPRSQACNLVLDIEFSEPMFRPGLFELFWAVNPDAFAESQKARFIISHASTQGGNLFVIPLCKLYLYSGNLHRPHYQKNIVGMRLDYPMNRTVGIKFHKIELMSNKQLNQFSANDKRNMIELEPFERVPGSAFTSLDVIIPKVYFGFENGVKRLTNDVPFLMFWLLLISVFIGLIVRSYCSGREGRS